LFTSSCNDDMVAFPPNSAFMRHKCIEMRKRIAKLVSNILNPFLMGMILILSASFSGGFNTRESIKWALVLIAFNVLPIFLFIIWLVRHNKLDDIFINIRKQRLNIYLLGIALVGASCIILLCFEAPPMLLALFVAFFSVGVVFMCINNWWKVSVHTASIASVAAALLIIYGLRAIAFIMLVPLVAWARVELGKHSLAQVVTGALLAPSMLVAEVHLFGLV